MAAPAPPVEVLHAMAPSLQMAMSPPYQMPTAADQQMQQMQQMQAMMAMAAASMTPGGVAFPTSMPTQPAMSQAMVAPPTDPAMAQVAPFMDPAMAHVYNQVFSQYLQAQAYAANTEVGGLGANGLVQAPYTHPAAFAPPPVAAPPPATIQVAIEGMQFQYHVTEDDLLKVFSRYGAVKHIRVDEAGTTGQICFEHAAHAQSAMADLNGKKLNGLEGTLRIVWATQLLPSPATAAAAAAPAVPSPYPAMPPFSGWGAPGGAAATPAWSHPGAVDAAVVAAGITGVASQPAPAAGVCGEAAARPAAPSAAKPGGSSSAGLPSTPTDDSGSGAGDSRGNAPAHVKGVKKYTCRFLIGIENDKDFQVVRRIIGVKGSNMKRVVTQTDAKLRLRGVGSGYFEGAGQRESTEPLQLCVSCTSSSGYHLAVRMVEELLDSVFSEYRSYCADNGRPAPDLHPVPQVVPTGRGGKDLGSGKASGDDEDDFAEQGEGAFATGKAKERRPRGRRSRGGKKNAEEGSKTTNTLERGDPPAMAPPVEDIERMIDQRNEARRQCNFAEADRIRQSLHERGVALMDEPGARGKGTEVTTWRYWRE